MWFSVYWNILMKWACTSSSFVTCWCWFFVWKIFTISILLLIIYWCWLFFMCKMFLSFLTDVYVIFLYWNILMKWMHFIFICHLLPLIIYWCWLLFMCKMFLLFSTDVYLIFLLLKHIDEVDALHLHLLFTWFLCGKYSTIALLLLIIYWCWLFFMCKMFLSFLTDVYVIFLYWIILMKCTHFIFICHLLPFIIYWCWLFFMCKMFLLFSTDVYLIFCYWNISMKWMHFIFICYLLMLIRCITAFDNLLMLTIFHVQNVVIILDWCLCDFLVLNHIDEVDALHFHLSLTYFFCGKYATISILLFIMYWCWLFFMWKCCYHSWLMFMWFSCTETYS